MIKKFICYIIMLGIIVLSLIGCGSNSGDNEVARFGDDCGYYYFENNGEIMHITNDINRCGKKIEYDKNAVKKIIIDDKITVKHTKGLFRGFIYTKSIEGLENLDVSKATDMSEMFMYCGASYLDIENWNTSKVINMSSMFEDSCVIALYLGNWDTSKVRNMSRMFYGCSYLDTIDISNWDVKNVKNMEAMFKYTNPVGKRKAQIAWNRFDNN